MIDCSFVVLMQFFKILDEIIDSLRIKELRVVSLVRVSADGDLPCGSLERALYCRSL